MIILPKRVSSFAVVQWLFSVVDVHQVGTHIRVLLYLLGQASDVVEVEELWFGGGAAALGAEVLEEVLGGYLVPEGLACRWSCHRCLPQEVEFQVDWTLLLVRCSLLQTSSCRPIKDFGEVLGER